MDVRKPNTFELTELLARSVKEVLPTREALADKLLSGERLRVYIGADATGPELHLGHATNFILLEKFRRLGHEVIVLFGDFTAMIGDPTDKEATRTQLTEEQVTENIATWKQQVSKLVDFDTTDNPARIVRNSEWLGTLNLRDVVATASSFTVQYMLERDMFEQRIQKGKPVYLHEFLYPLMQGYDSVALDVDIEIGGTDQTFNMLAGRVLQRRYHAKEKFVIATTLLENPKTGKKLMSKSEGDYVSLNDTPENMYGKIMALPDETLAQMFMDCTMLPQSEVAEVVTALGSGELHPKEAKMRLAREVVTLYHGGEAALQAEAMFTTAFTEGKVPTGVAVCAVNEGTLLMDALIQAGLISSKSDWRRLVEQGGVHTYKGEVSERVLDLQTPAESAVYRIGKHRFIEIQVTK